MSKSGLSSVDIPIDVEYEQSLKRAVRNGLAAKEEVTINTARERAEKELGLKAGFFKNDAAWKSKSKEIVQAAFHEPQSSPEKPKTTAKSAVSRAKVSAKRKSNDVPPTSNKRSKKATTTVPDSDASELSDSEVDISKDEEDASEFGGSDEDEEPKKAAKNIRGKTVSKPQAKSVVKRSKKSGNESVSGSEAEAEARHGPRAAKKKAAPSQKSQDVVNSESEGENEIVSARRTTTDQSELSDVPDSKDDVPPKQPTEEDDDESDMSVLIDDPPPKKKRASNGTSKAKATKTPKPAAAKKKGSDLTPNEEEIKRLQGWLVKCGVRKMWHNELKGCDTEKEKIKHLKKMLEEVGMTGRYSNEKAKDIFEARELAAELEEAQQYAAKWGTKDDKDDDGSDSEAASGDDDAESKAAAAVPRRPKGFVDFGDSGDDSG